VQKYSGSVSAEGGDVIYLVWEFGRRIGIEWILGLSFSSSGLVCLIYSKGVLCPVMLCLLGKVNGLGSTCLK
jgi:hypothetical protein